jgi:endoglycosylceramidase
MNLRLLLFPALLLLTGCIKTTGIEPLRTEGRSFVDPEGNPLLLRGINLVNKNPSDGYLTQDTLGLFDKISSWGFNCIRLGIIWDGIEPVPGRFDTAYLDKITEFVDRFAARGIYTLLDMHQDLYSRRFSDGAPEWATLTDSMPHLTGAIWSDSYLISPAVQRAFDHFWNNSPASDGLGLQDHYAMAWKFIAQRFSNHPGVLGYDIMNEPFNGSQGAAILPAMLTEFATLKAELTGTVLSEQEVLETWADEEKRIEALKFIEDPARYARVIDAAGPLNAAFEKEVLMPFYQKIAETIREVDSNHILFLEHAYFANSGLATAIEPVKGKNGQPDPLVAYAAHGYDLLTDTKFVDSQSTERVSLIFGRIDEAARRMNIPVLVGEWGAFNGSSEGFDQATKHILSLFEKYGFSNTYWAYRPNIESDSYFPLLK